MQPQNKTVTVLLATHNSEKFLACQLDSLLSQTYDNIKILICDDNSSDNTENLLKSYAKCDLRISLIKSEQKLGSAQANFMFLLSHAPISDFYMFCDHDDRWVKDKIECTLKKMLSGDIEKPRLVHSDLFVSDAELNVISPSLFNMQKLPKNQTFAQSLVQNSITGCTVMINHPLRILAEKKINYNNCENMIMHDWYLGILARACGTVDFISRPLIFYRQHGNNEVGAKDVCSVGYIAKRIFAAKKNKKLLYDTYIQAQDIANIYRNELGENFELTNLYGSFTKTSKPKKIFLYFKYGFKKNTFLRRIGQLFYM